MGFWDDINAAKPMENREGFFPPGSFLVEVYRSKSIFGGYQGDSFVFEFHVLGSNVAECPPGDTRVWILNFSKNKDLCMRNLKAFFVAFFGTDPGPRTAEICGAAFSEQNALAGGRLQLEAFEKDTRPKYPGGPTGVFTVHQWYPVADWTNPTIAEVLAKGGVVPPTPSGPAYRTGPAVGPWPGANGGARNALPPAPPPPAPPPPMPVDPRAGWMRSPDGLWVLNPHTNGWERA